MAGKPHRRLQDAWPALLWLAQGACAADASALFSDVGAELLRPGATIKVEKRLLQFQLAPGYVLSVEPRAEFTLPDPNADNALNVLAGEVVVADLLRNRVRVLTIGRYPVPDTSTAMPSTPAGSAALDDLTHRQGFRLSDSIMLRQQDYVESLSIDVRDLNRALLSILRALIPH